MHLYPMNRKNGVERLVFFVVAALMMPFLAALAHANDSAPFDGLPGGHEGPPASAGPPENPAAWHKLPGVVLGEDDVWGNRINARTTFALPGGGMGLLYSSHPGRANQTDADWRASQIEQGLTIGPSGSLAFTRNLVDWRDYPGNPVLNETQCDWQTPARVHTRDMLYDPVNERWVAYFGNICGDDVPGIRTLGVAYSTDLIHWEYADGPLLTVADYAAAVPDRIEASEEELHEHGRIYLGWAMHYGGRYYLTISGTETVGETEAEGVRSTSTGRIVMRADSPEGPFEYADDIDADAILPGSKPVYWAGRWYSVFTGSWDGQPGFGLAWSESLFGEVHRNPANPIIPVESTQRSNPILFCHEGVWGVLFSRGGDWSDELPLRIALANIHPSLLRAGEE